MILAKGGPDFSIHDTKAATSMMEKATKSGIKRPPIVDAY